MLRWTPPLTVALLVLPMAAGLAGTILPAFGFFPPLGGNTFSLEPWRRLFELPGLGTSVRISLVTGFGTTLISLLIVAAFCAAWHGTRWFQFAERMLAPILSVPHTAVAFGIAFLLAPSGWIMRLLSPWATGFNRPPDWLTVHDPDGFTLMAGLIVKEVPYLLIMTLAALGQVNAGQYRTVARTFGYHPINGWLKAIFPRVYPQIRLPVFAVLAYGLSVVDVSLILGPTTPAPLAPRLIQLFSDPDLELRFVASAGALLQVGLVAGCLAIWLFAERIIQRLSLRWITAGQRGGNDYLPRLGAGSLVGVIGGTVLASVLCITIWSFADTWRFPHAFPPSITFDNWTQNFPNLHGSLLNTVSVAGIAVLVGLLLAVGVLEHEANAGARSFVGGSGFLYSPLIIPQIAFLFGTQILLVLAQLDGRWLSVAWLHLLFVFPYIFLSLSDTYHAWDERYTRTGLCLGASRTRVFFRIKLPMLLRPLMTAGAVGFAVSIGLYLPTLFAGSGRYPTLTTEIVALSTGGDNRLISLYALLQMILPLLGFLIAVAVPAWLFRHRQGMQVTR